MEINVPIVRVTREVFIRELKMAEDWRLAVDQETGEPVLVVSKGLSVAAYKGPDPKVTSPHDMGEFVGEIRDVAKTPSVARRRT